MATVETTTAWKETTGADQSKLRLQDLVPIVMVIVGGCENCAEKMVERALKEGSSPQDIDRTLRLVEGTRKLDCFAKAVGPEVTGRMEGPLIAGRRTLERAVEHSSSGCACGS